MGNLDSKIAQQFGASAERYYASPLHSSGADLERLIALVSAHPMGRVLDLGCGAGHVSYSVSPYASQVVAYDLSEEMLALVFEKANEKGLNNIVTRSGSVNKLPFEANSFDFVFSRYSARHWRDLPTALLEARRVLKEGGQAAFIDVVSPVDPLLDSFQQTIEMLRDTSHVRDHSVAEWEKAARYARLSLRSIAFGRLSVDFASWVKRINTPQTLVDAIRLLQQSATSDVIEYFDIKSDGTFVIDTMLVEAVAI